MKTRGIKLTIVGLLVGGLFLFVVARSRLHSAHLDRVEGFRHQGLQWLSWTATERENFVYGYMEGYSIGKTDACLAADKLFDLDKPRVLGHDDTFPSRRCLASVPAYNNVVVSPSAGPDFSAYTTAITEFYAKHPSQRDTSLLVLMGMLTGAKKVTADELYSRLTGWNSPAR